MKVGDLVTLSSYGKKIKRTGWIKDGDVGIIKESRGAAPWGSYKILWCNSVYKHSNYRDYPTRGSYWDWQLALDRRDLKYAKKKS